MPVSTWASIFCHGAGFYKTAVLLGATLLSAALLYVYLRVSKDESSLYLLSISVIMISITLPWWAILLFSLANIISTAVFSLLYYNGLSSSVNTAVFFILSITVILIIFRNHRLKITGEGLSRLNEALDATIFSLAYATELRDHETGNHLDRTTKYLELLLNSLVKHPDYKGYLTETYIRDMLKASVLHDIGKVGIPDQILLKPGKLTSEEFDIIKNHCRYGQDIILKAKERVAFRSFFSLANKIVYFHHEKWDGSGYPEGLQGDAIPISARLMALADVYDAMRSKRCYKDPMPHEKCKAIITSESGRHFDPLVVECFLENESEFKRISEDLM
jgi:HD-GYP domain-containing protein (c-di-GMP phosphodiesterase class II)